MKDLEEVISGIVLDEHMEISFKELCDICGIAPETIVEMIDEGLIERPPEGEKRNWQFRGYEVRRIQIALRLQRDLHVNLPGAALAVELLEKLEEMHRRMKR
jgi:chaperone modulatory protein CbpM